MATKNVPAKRAADLPANWEEQMAADASAEAAAVAGIGGGTWLSIRNGVLKFQATPTPDSQLDCVVLGSLFDFAYYGGVPFDADNPASPVCWALGPIEKELEPSEESHDRQADACAGCPQNEFGSSDRGKGKACKNQVRLALLHVDNLRPDLIHDAQIVMLRVPPTSLTAWAAHVKKIANTLEKPPYAVVTRVSVAPDDKVQVRVSFEVQDDIRDKKLLGAIFAKRQEALKLLETPYQWQEQAGRSGKQQQQQQQRAAPPAPRKPEPAPKTKKEAEISRRAAEASARLAPKTATKGGFGKF